MTVFNCLELRGGGDAPREQAGGGVVAVKMAGGAARPLNLKSASPV